MRNARITGWSAAALAAVLVTTAAPAVALPLEEAPTAEVGDLEVTVFDDRYPDGLYDPSKVSRNGETDRAERSARLLTADGVWREGNPDSSGVVRFTDVPVGEAQVHVTYPNGPGGEAFFDATGAVTADDIERLPTGSYQGTPTAFATVDVDADGESVLLGLTALRAVADVNYADGTPAEGVTVELGSAGDWYPATEYDFAGGEGIYEAFQTAGYVRHLPDELGVRVTAPTGYEVDTVTVEDGAVEVTERDGAFWMDTADSPNYFWNNTFTVTLKELVTGDVLVTGFDDRYADGVFDPTKTARDGRTDEKNSRIARLETPQGEMRFTSADANGDYLFEDVPVGEAKVYFLDPNSYVSVAFFDATDAASAADIERLPNGSFMGSPAGVATVSVDEDGEEVLIGMTALRAAAKVVNEDGSAVSDAAVELGSAGDWYAATEYDFAGGEGTYEAFSASGSVRHLPDEIGVRLTVPEGYRVASVTAEDGGAIPVAERAGAYWLDTTAASTYFSAPTFVITLAEAQVAPVATAPPTIGGTPSVGRTLTARPGTWQPADVTFGYRWLRDGQPIAGATARTYKVVSADAGKSLTVRVSATEAGNPNAGTATSAGVFVKYTSKTSVIVKPYVGTASQSYSATVTVKTSAGPQATGKVTLSVNGKTYTGDLVNGKVTIVLPKQTRGAKVVVVSYPGSGTVAASSAVSGFVVRR